jgi:hypothetical protein
MISFFALTFLSVSFSAWAEIAFRPGDFSSNLKDESERWNYVNSYCTSSARDERIFSKDVLEYISTTAISSLPGSLGLKCFSDIEQQLDAASAKELAKYECATQLNQCETIHRLKESYRVTLGAARGSKKDYLEATHAVVPRYFLQENHDFDSNLIENYLNRPEGRFCQLSAISRYPDVIQREMSRVVTSTDADCLRTLVISHAFEASSFEVDAQDYDQSCEANPVRACEQISERIILFAQNLQTLTAALLQKLSGKTLAELQSCYPEMVAVKDQTQLVNLLSKFQQDQACKPPVVGETKVFRADERASPTGLPMAYSITPRERTVELKVPMDFFTHEPQVDIPSFKKKVNDCLQAVSPYLNDGSGRNLELRVIDAEERLRLPEHLRPGINQVMVSRDTMRASSGHYSEFSNCTTITHEVLHLTGLVDEYKELERDYKCRALVRGNSILSDSPAAYGRVVPEAIQCECRSESCRNILSGTDEFLKKVYLHKIHDVPIDFYNQYCRTWERPSVGIVTKDFTREELRNVDPDFPLFEKRPRGFSSYNLPYFYDSLNTIGFTGTECDCPPGDDECISQLEGVRAQIISSFRDIPNNTCPEESRLLERKTLAPGETFSSDSTLPKFTILTKTDKKSLLRPSHFTQILSGACKTDSTYQRCSVLSYDMSCTEMPLECRSEASYLGQEL